jgi:RNA polymerase sigma-70 factor (ECF subfamily)
LADRDGPEADSDPDLEILRRIGAGDGVACALLVDRHLRRITALAGHMLGNRADAEDVAQDVFLRVWKQAPTWRSGEAKFSTWLHRVTLNLCTDRLRRRREVGLEAIGDAASDLPAPDAGLQESATIARVRGALAQLPDRQREAILLCHFQELGNIEAAAVLELSVEALESLLSRGRRRLRQLLIEEMPDLTGST